MEKKKFSWEKVAVCLLDALITMTVIGVVYLMLASCSAPKALEERHHYNSEYDSIAVKSVVDKRLEEVKEQMIREVTNKISTQQTEQNSTEQEQERITETVTTWVDSLGRAFRQEQRTTERDISRQQQLREERMQQEYEQRLMTAVDSLSAAWKERFDSVSFHKEETDSSFVSETPTADDNRPWWKQILDAAKWMFVGAIVFAVIWFTRKLWSPLLKFFS